MQYQRNVFDRCLNDSKNIAQLALFSTDGIQTARFQLLDVGDVLGHAGVATIALVAEFTNPAAPKKISQSVASYSLKIMKVLEQHTGKMPSFGRLVSAG